MSLSVSGWKRVPEEFRKRAFELWIETGSLSKVTNIMREDGWRNSNGKPYAESQISVQAKAYLLEHWKDEELILKFNADRKRMGLPEVTQKEFEEYMVLTAAKIWGRKNHKARYWDWIAANDFWKYEYIWTPLHIQPRPINQPPGPTSPRVAAKAVQK